MRVFAALVLCTVPLAAQEHLSIPTPDGTINADSYGKNDRAVVLAHGGGLNKESWAKQARILGDAGFHAVSIDFDDDHATSAVLATVRYLRSTGAKSVSIVGGSMGGSAAEDASIESKPGEIDRIVVLAASTGGPVDKLKGRTLFIVARDDASQDGPRLPQIRENYEKAPQPKKLIILEGSAHAQHLFATDQGDRLMREILTFLTEP